MATLNIIVTGLERSGTRWMTALLSLHPDVTATHTSIPQEYMPDTHYPDLSQADAVVWMIRYEPFRLLSMDTVDFNRDRPLSFLPPALYESALKLITPKTVFVSLEALISPLGLPVFHSLLKQLSLNPLSFPSDSFNPNDPNLKYMSEPLLHS